MLMEGQPSRLELLGVRAGLWRLCAGEPGRGVDVLSLHDLGFTLWNLNQIHIEEYSQAQNC